MTGLSLLDLVLLAVLGLVCGIGITALGPGGVLATIARAVPTRTLTYALVAILFALSPYLALHR